MSTAAAIVRRLLEDDDAKDFALSNLPDYNEDNFGYVQGYVGLYGKLQPGEDEHEATCRVMSILQRQYPGSTTFGVFEVFQAMEEAGLGTVEQIEAEHFAESVDDVDIEGTINRALPKRWKVQTHIGGGWEDAEWLEDDKPLRFSSRIAAERAIDEFIADTAEAVAQGHMSEPYDRRHYRAVPADPLEK